MCGDNLVGPGLSHLYCKSLCGKGFLMIMPMGCVIKGLTASSKT